MQHNFMTHIVAGYPNLAQCQEIILRMSAVGVGFIEVQFPFSDPIADGETLMQANAHVLNQGIRIADCFYLVEQISQKINTPLLIMTYFNVLYQYGLARFCKRASASGIYGLIVPDIPIDAEAQEHYWYYCQKYHLHPISVISPLTPDLRLQKIAKIASGLVYCVSTFGTTGMQGSLNSNLSAYIQSVRQFITVPLAVGFGISDLSLAKKVLQYADIAVMGSVLTRLIKAHPKDPARAVADFLNNQTPALT